MVQRHVTETNSSNSNSKDPEDAMVRYIERVAGRAQPDMRKDDEDESWGKWRSSPARDPCRLMSTCVCVCVCVGAFVAASFSCGATACHVRRRTQRERPGEAPKLLDVTYGH